MTLGELIRQLEAIPKTYKFGDEEPKPVGVRFDFCGTVPTGIDSYRGYYDQLALGWVDRDQYPEPKYIKTLAELLAIVKAADGATFQGYKGGDYTMDKSTKVWVSNYGHSDSTALCGVKFNGYAVTLQTQDEDEW